MGATARVLLPGYTDINDTNLDHFSLYGDIDNVLIKRAKSGSGTVAQAGIAGFTTDTINHGLGYIPFFTVYANISDIIGNNWKLVNNENNPFSVPNAICSADTSNLYVTNFQGVSMNYSYDIFYDDMSQTGTPSITESKSVFKIIRPGKNINSKNPNDYIMHSDLNNLKILKQATTSVSLTSGVTSVAHGMSLNTPYKFFCFVKFPDGKTLFAGNAGGYSYDGSHWIRVAIDGTNIKLYTGTTYTANITYIIYGSGVDSTLDNSGAVMACVSGGKNIATVTNPEDVNFHSKYQTLKYYLSNTWNMGAVTAETVKTISHNLGYVPFFIGFVNDIYNFIANSYCIAPFFEGRSFIGSPDQDIGAFVYADSTNIYLRAYYQVNATGTSRTFNWYYKIFKNNLGL